MREAVRSGRRANFFITENRFIDCYAAKVGGSGVAVYSILQRCANSETKETWISAGKMAEVLDIDKSTVYRKLKELEELRLIRSMRTREKTIYVVLEVPPPRPEAGPTPLFDAIDSKTQDLDATWPPVASARTGSTSAIDSRRCNSSIAPVQQSVASVQPISGASEKCNKEEQDESNKTQEQDVKGNKTLQEPPEITESADRIVATLGLPASFTSTAVAAVKTEMRQTGQSAVGAFARITTEANLASRRGLGSRQFIEDFVAQDFAKRIIEHLDLVATNTMVSTIAAAVRAEVKYKGLSIEQAAADIARLASEDRQNGKPIDKFYFEDTKWRTSNGGRNKSEQQFDRINRARERAIENIKARSRT